MKINEELVLHQLTVYMEFNNSTTVMTDVDLSISNHPMYGVRVTVPHFYHTIGQRRRKEFKSEARTEAPRSRRRGEW